MKSFMTDIMLSISNTVTQFIIMKGIFGVVSKFPLSLFHTLMSVKNSINKYTLFKELYNL